MTIELELVDSCWHDSYLNINYNNLLSMLVLDLIYGYSLMICLLLCLMLYLLDHYDIVVVLILSAVLNLKHSWLVRIGGNIIYAILSYNPGIWSTPSSTGHRMLHMFVILFYPTRILNNIYTSTIYPSDCPSHF